MLAQKIVEIGTPLILAAEHGHMLACALMIKAGASLTDTDKNGRNAFLTAAKAGRANVMQNMIAKQKSLMESTDSEGNNALLLAAASATPSAGHTEVCKFLLENGTNPAAVNKDGKNAIQLAASRGNAGVLSLLLAATKDLLATNKERA